MATNGTQGHPSITGQSTIGLGLEVEKHSIRNDYLNISQDEEQHKDLLRDPCRRTEAAAESGSSTTTFDDDDRESVTMNADDALDSSQQPNSRPLRPSFICRTLQRRRRTPRFGHPSHPQTSTFNSQACPRREAPEICDSELVPSLYLVVAQLRSANEPSRRTLEELEGPCDCLRRVEATTRAASGGVSTATERLLKVETRLNEIRRLVPARQSQFANCQACRMGVGWKVAKEQRDGGAANRLTRRNAECGNEEGEGRTRQNDRPLRLKEDDKRWRDPCIGRNRKDVKDDSKEIAQNPSPAHPQTSKP
ncbi:hypothetical protein BKA70DRAFT_1236442 [Coprinopsis sp. MPI-PUGE-AT-0042]|nr:hypothetical protein BKA70DRAFT_1236442 [Coprinopsis sp. MPI-PUGE-AT-0042]